MSVPRITARQFEDRLRQAILQRNSSVDVTTGPVRDYFVRPQATVLEAQNEAVRQVYNLLALIGLNDLPNQYVDDFCGTEQVLRSSGTPAFITLTFSRVSKPTVNLPVATNFPVATDVDPLTGSQITFVTTQPATLLAASADAYYNPVTNLYELNIDAASINNGPSTVVGRNRVTKPLRPLPGFDAVTNKTESTGGLPAESNSDMGERYLLRIAGTELGTPAGLNRYTRQVFSNVQDAYVVYGNDPFLTRADVDAGAVDVWVLGASPVERTVTVAFPGKLVPIVLDRQPVLSVLSVTSGVTFTQNVDYVFQPDGGNNARSTRASDAIVFTPLGVAPAFGDPITITYTYDNLVIALQSFFQTPDYKSDGADVLFRAGIRVDIAISGVLKVNSGNPSQVLLNVQQAMLDLINGTTTVRGYRLGQSVEEFDIDSALARVGGVDNFTYTLLAPLGQVGVSDIPILPNQYARLSVANLSITLG